MAYQIEYFYTSHTGKCRKINQDNLLCLTRILESDNDGTRGIFHGSVNVRKNEVFAVFDGMGGEEQGEMAAYIAAYSLKNYVHSDDAGDLINFCRFSNSEICKYAKDNDVGYMGTTGAILKFTPQKIELCNIGDSKIFAHSENKLYQISTDHVAAAPFGKKPPLYQHLGMPEEEIIIEPYTAAYNYNAGDIYLICSDGLTDMVGFDEIEQCLSQNDCAAASKQLLCSALDNGGKDNITFILLSVKYI